MGIVEHDKLAEIAGSITAGNGKREYDPHPRRVMADVDGHEDSEAHWGRVTTESATKPTIPVYPRRSRQDAG